MSPLRRRSLYLMSIVLGAPALVLARPKANQAPEPLSWSELIPSGWDPVKSLGVTSLSQVDLDDPRLRRIWDTAPTNPRLDGRSVRMLGHLVPLDEAATALREFLLVAQWGACIHTPAPPANQIVHVKLAEVARGYHAMDPVWVDGTMRVVRDSSGWGASGYTIEKAQVSRYVAPGR